MLARRIIPCLDVREGKVVKGVQFRDHVVLGDIVDLATRYCEEGADELVFYDITASVERRVVDTAWIGRVAKAIDIPFCVAGGIRTPEDAKQVLRAGADKVSINTPALENPRLIRALAEEFGRQCVVVGVDSRRMEDGSYAVFKYTGSVRASRLAELATWDWLVEAQEMGAGEIVLNCMNADGTKAGYDLEQLKRARALCHVPLIASGGAGSKEDFLRVFAEADADGGLAASVFHKAEIRIPDLKMFLRQEGVTVR